MPEYPSLRSSKKPPLESLKMASRKRGIPDAVFFDALMFDLDGTLIDSSVDIAMAANHVREVLKLPLLSLEQVQSYIGDGVRTLLSRALQTKDESEIDRAVEIWRPFYQKHCLDHTKTYAGIDQMLQELGSTGIPLGVVSNKPVQFCNQIIEGLDLGKYFKSIVGGDSAVERKPHPAPLYLAAKELKVEGNRILMIGDSENDILSAQKAGFKSCGVLWGIGLEKGIRDAGPDYIIQMPSDVSRLIRTPYLNENKKESFRPKS